MSGLVSQSTKIIHLGLPYSELAGTLTKSYRWVLPKDNFFKNDDLVQFGFVKNTCSAPNLKRPNGFLFNFKKANFLVSFFVKTPHQTEKPRAEIPETCLLHSLHSSFRLIHSLDICSLVITRGLFFG